jgi:hypothetical protein
MLGRMSTKMKTMQEKADDDRKAHQEELKEMMKANTKSRREDIKSGQEKIRSIVDAWMTDMNDNRKETMYCQEMTEANTEKTEPDPGMMQTVAEHEVVPKEESVVKPVKGTEEVA